MKINFRGLFFTILYFFSIISYGKEVDTIRLLIFSKTNGYRHTSIKEGKKALLKIAYENMENHLEHIEKMENLFLNQLKDRDISFKVYGKSRVPGFLNISFYPVPEDC